MCHHTQQKKSLFFLMCMLLSAAAGGMVGPVAPVSCCLQGPGSVTTVPKSASGLRLEKGLQKYSPLGRSHGRGYVG